MQREGPEAEVRFSEPSLGGKVEVMFEGRILKAGGGAFTDRFAANDVRVYRLKLGRPSRRGGSP